MVNNAAGEGDRRRSGGLFPFSQIGSRPTATLPSSSGLDERTAASGPRVGRVLLFIFGLALATTAPATRLEAKSLLWRARSDQGTLYVLGSIHLLRKEDYPLSPAIEAAFAEARTVAFEVDFGATEPLKLQTLMAQRGVYRDGRTLPQAISEGTYAMAAERAKQLGIDIKTLHPFKPWMVALTLTSAQLQKLGFDPKYGVDRHLFERARAAEKAVIGLETPEEQFSLLDAMPPKQQEAMLLQTMKDLERIEHSVHRLIAAWKAGDQSVMEDLVLAGFKEYPDLYQRVMLDRNRRWLARLEAFLTQSETTLVVIGAGHVVGKGNVIELLRERGYRMEQLR
ncbi:MAG TPA: TraB/GumN family protein [Candidatus Eisenbacteria bacterium]|nr:TraB/GumN family protein [Candidatus Eisenbacteria bacterium]